MVAYDYNPATLEAREGESWSKASQGKSLRPHMKKIEANKQNQHQGKRAGDMAQVIQCVKHEALSSIPSIAKRKQGECEGSELVGRETSGWGGGVKRVMEVNMTKIRNAQV
jgi:hypothetical protein